MSKEKNDAFDEFTRYKYVIENIKDIIWESDSNLVFTYMSPTIKGMLGYDASDMIGRSLFEFLAAESKLHIREQWSQAVPKRVDGSFKSTVLYDLGLVCKDGNTIWCEVCVKPVFNDTGFTGYIGTTRDVSEKKGYLEKLKQKNEQLEDLVSLDILTGAFNRRKFEYLIGLEIDKKEKYDSPFSIIMFDIDEFKNINDFNGHKKGDQVLQDITTIIKHSLRATDKLFRWGGDEFIILLPEVTLQFAYKVAHKVREAIEAYDLDIHSQKATVSLGVGEYALHETQDHFVNRVDKALLMAKFNGKNKVEQG